MSLETGLRLQIDPRHVARLAGHPLLRRATRRATRKLYCVYYDTPGLDLWRAGVTLRLLRSGKHWIQTVSSGGSVAAGLHQQRVIETAIATPLPDFNALDASDVAAHFSSLELRAELKPLMVADFTRSSCMLAPADGVAIEAGIDHGIIKSGDATAPVCELALEMRTGPVWRAYQVAMQLLESVPLLVEDRSTAERGIALHRLAPPKPLKTPPSPLVANMSCNEAFKALVLTCVAHYTANQRGMLERADPEYLHQLRVALRRLRSVFSTFAPLFPPGVLESPIAETRRLARALGEARDWDVLVAETLPPIAAHYAHHAGLTALALSAADLRRRASRAARRAVISAPGQGLLLALGAWISAETWRAALDDAQQLELERPAVEFAQTVLGAALKRVRRRGRNFAQLAPTELHRLRIAAKKLRYAAEFFAPLFDQKAVRDYRAKLSHLQETLGSYNDAVKMTHLAACAGRTLKGVPANEARGIILGWSAGMQHAGTRYLRRIWKDFCRSEPFWK
jgi:triphosphatase